MKNKSCLSIVYEESSFDRNELQEIENDLNACGVELTARERGWRINASLDFFVPIVEFIFSPDFLIEMCENLAVSGVIQIISRLYKKFHHHPIKKIQSGQIVDVSPNVHFRIGNDALVLPVDAEYSKYVFAINKFTEIALKSRSTENTYVFFEEDSKRLIAKTERQIIDEECKRQNFVEKTNLSIGNARKENGVETGQDGVKEHALKEMLKKIVDDSPNYSEQVKADLKSIIDLENSPEEILKTCIVYFSMNRWN